MIDPTNAKNALQEFETKRIQLKKGSVLTYLIVVLLPIISALFLLRAGTSGPTFFVPFIIACLFAAGTYFFKIHEPFRALKENMKAILLGQFMEVYHPDIQYRYTPSKKDVKRIIKASKLVSADHYYEEDVLHGTLGNGAFYISEIHLKRQSGKTTVTSFKGILFTMTIPGKNFPKSLIQSKMGFLSQLFKDFIKNEDYGFWYDTNDKQGFEKELSPLLPFIRHLMTAHRDVRIKTEGNTVTLLLGSDMKFLDDPKPQLEKSFFDPEYYDQLGIQLNSLLFIVESFVHGLEQTEIEERLELKALEYAKALSSNSHGKS